MHPALYKAEWYWNEVTGKLEAEGLLDNPTRSKIKSSKCSSYTNVRFQDNVDRKQQQLFKLKYQRIVPPGVPAVVTLQDIKDIATFLVTDSIPKSVLCLLHSHQVNKLFRALIIYFQLYLKIREDLRYRMLAQRMDRLKHPIAAEREAWCNKHLSSLRAIIGREYASLVTGTGFFKQFHHMNNSSHLSSNFKDVRLYEYLFKFAARVVWIALLRCSFREIELELYRLFGYSPPSASLDLRRRTSLRYLGKSEQSIVFGDESKRRFNSLSPIVVNIFTNEYKADCFVSKIIDCDRKLTGIEALMNLPEEMVEMFGLTIGILGHSRDNYEPNLHLKQQVIESLVEEELEKARSNVIEPEKPSIMLYQLLEELDRTIDLQNVADSRGLSYTAFGEMVRSFQENHFEDSKRSYRMWKSVKGD